MSSHKKKTILLVEDEAVISIVTSRAIQKFGYNVVAVNSGKKAVETIYENEYINLVIINFNLDEGVDVHESARRIVEKRNIPIIFRSSRAEKEHVDKVREITNYAYVIEDPREIVLQSSIEMAFEHFDLNHKLQ